ncbi:MAG: PSP1 domain-containing [Prolixibacteraceae bacterium]|nr:MAG: PSP1 domain-containing [Prolixibacteraceae bacterium]
MHEKDIDTIERGVCRTKSGCCAKLHVTNWLSDIKLPRYVNNIVEVRFKNTRKDYYQNVNNLNLLAGDLVAVESSPGHDIGIVSLMGPLVEEQMKKHKPTLINGEFRKVYRIAKQNDIDKWKEAISLEHQTMIRSRQMTADLKLNMKIGDVEYQGDRTKAIFYYIADDRVDFRQLIKVLAENFHIRVEMKQIGARQEAGRIGGIGPCGREICCSTWIHNFISVSTNAARYQEISLNPQKLAGQCGKLKCCLNFELASYIDAQKNFPATQYPLETETGTYIFLKADIFNASYLYILQGNTPSTQITVPVKRVAEIQQLNKKGKKPERLLLRDDSPAPAKELDTFHNVVGQEELTRFDKPNNAKRKKKRNFQRNPNRKPNA